MECRHHHQGLCLAQGKKVEHTVNLLLYRRRWTDLTFPTCPHADASWVYVHGVNLEFPSGRESTEARCPLFEKLPERDGQVGGPEHPGDI
jgi:hypothetical protein